MAFGDAGSLLWAEMGGADAMGDRRALITEACRIADRLEKLHGLMGEDGADWLRLAAEARAQAMALKQLSAELRQRNVDVPRGGAQPEQPDGPAEPRGGDVVDELAARRADRIAGAAGGQLPAVPDDGGP